MKEMNMPQNLQITLVQSAIQWGEIETNLRNLEEMLATVKQTDMIVLPEMFATGFVVDDVESLAGGDRVLSWMNVMAMEHDAAIVGSVALQIENRWFNRLFMVEPNGNIQQYDKRHLFVKSKEPDYFEKGSEPVVFAYKGWRVCPQVCYDLRFPVWSRNACQDSQFRYDVLLYVANWPAARAEHWNTLLKARAIENQAYVLAANCVGGDKAHRMAYQGDTQAIDPNGVIVAKAREGVSECLTVELSYDNLHLCRDGFPVWRDWESTRL